MGDAQANRLHDPASCRTRADLGLSSRKDTAASAIGYVLLDRAAGSANLHQQRLALRGELTSRELHRMHVE